MKVSIPRSKLWMMTVWVVYMMLAWIILFSLNPALGGKLIGAMAGTVIFAGGGIGLLVPALNQIMSSGLPIKLNFIVGLTSIIITGCVLIWVIKIPLLRRGRRLVMNTGKTTVTAIMIMAIMALPLPNSLADETPTPTGPTPSTTGPEAVLALCIVTIVGICFFTVLYKMPTPPPVKKDVPQVVKVPNWTIVATNQWNGPIVKADWYYTNYPFIYSINTNIPPKPKKSWWNWRTKSDSPSTQEAGGPRTMSFESPVTFTNVWIGSYSPDPPVLDLNSVPVETAIRYCLGLDPGTNIARVTGYHVGEFRPVNSAVDINGPWRPFKIQAWVSSKGATVLVTDGEGEFWASRYIPATMSGLQPVYAGEMPLGFWYGPDGTSKYYKIEDAGLPVVPR